MRRLGRRAVVLAATLLAGCVSPRPYARDPLLRDGASRWGDHGRARSAAHPLAREPEPPRPPAPTDLPTLEWERIAE